MDVRESTQILSLTLKNSQDFTGPRKREYSLSRDTELAMEWVLGRTFSSW